MTHLRILIHSYSEILDKYSTDRPQKRCIDIDLACLIYTSGSSGISKGAAGSAFFVTLTGTGEGAGGSQVGSCRTAEHSL